jgi:hypothetical protein
MTRLLLIHEFANPRFVSAVSRGRCGDLITTSGTVAQTELLVLQASIGAASSSALRLVY